MTMSAELPSLNDTMREQQDLPALCADRMLQTREICEPNAYYGNDYVLKLYAGLPLDRSLKCVIPHGIVFTEEKTWDAETNSMVPAVMVYPQWRCQAYRRNSSKFVVPGAAPFVYVRELLGSNIELKRNGTLFFLPHSTHWDNAEIDLQEIDARLRQLPVWMHPITICVYWKDFNLGQSRYFSRSGYRVVSAGHIFDRNFLFRLFHLCSQHEYSCGVELGGHIFSSIEAGCRYIHLSGVNTNYSTSLLKSSVDEFPFPDGVRSEIEEVFSIEGVAIERQKEIAGHFFCCEHKMTSSELRDFFLFCDALDRSGAGVWRKSRYYSFPMSWRRAGWATPKRRARQGARRLLLKLSQLAKLRTSVD
jgi:hypothetical protein